MIDKNKYTSDWQQVRQHYINKHGNKCEACGVPGTRKKPLHLHHKNGNKKDNTEANLELLCSRCHFIKSIKMGQVNAFSMGIRPRQEFRRSKI